MSTSTISTKYQVVIPKEVRKKYKLKPGQKVTFSDCGDGRLAIETPLDALADIQKEFAGKKIWGDDPAAYIRKQRDDWDN